MNPQVQQAVLELYEDLVRRFRQEQQSLPGSRIQDDWDSPCITHRDANSGLTYWQPVPRQDETPLNEVARGLEVSIHPDLLAYYGCLWADGIRVDSPWGEIGLIQVWNPEDLEQLKENQLGHAFMRLKKRLPLSFFIGVQRDDYIISLDNERGVVLRERLGRRADQAIANSLVEFLEQLTPNLKPYDEFQ